MSTGDIIVLLAIAGAMALAVRSIRKSGRNGCAGCCAACGRACAGREARIKAASERGERET